MADVEPKTVTREAFSRELVEALDDLVASARHHGELIKASCEKSEEAPRQRGEPVEAARRDALRAGLLVWFGDCDGAGPTLRACEHRRRLSRIRVPRQSGIWTRLTDHTEPAKDPPQQIHVA
jgi:hypothetical protein